MFGARIEPAFDGWRLNTCTHVAGGSNLSTELALTGARRSDLSANPVTNAQTQDRLGESRTRYWVSGLLVVPGLLRKDAKLQESRTDAGKRLTNCRVGRLHELFKLR